jgi:hypothetical protein
MTCRIWPWKDCSAVWIEAGKEVGPLGGAVAVLVLVVGAERTLVAERRVVRRMDLGESILGVSVLEFLWVVEIAWSGSN